MPENPDLPCSTNFRVAEPLIERIMRIALHLPAALPTEVKGSFTTATKN